MIFILGFLAIVFSVVGISFVVKGFWEVPDADKIVSPEEYEQIQKDVSVAKEEGEILRKQLDRLAVELEDSQTKLEQVKSVESEAGVLKNKEMQYHNEIQKLKHDLDYLYNRADTQADEAAGALEVLGSQNEKLKDEMQGLKAKLDDVSVEEMKAEKEKLQKQMDETSAKLKSLDQTLSVSRSQSQSQMEKANSTIAQLNQENEKLKMGIKDIVSKIGQVEAAFAHLKLQKEEQLKQANETIRELNQKTERLTSERNQNSEKITDLEKVLAQSKKEKVTMISGIPEAVVKDSSHAASQAVDRGELPKELERLKLLNDFMVDQEKLLQMELTRHRARAIGLEAICQELRKQLNQKT